MRCNSGSLDCCPGDPETDKQKMNGFSIQVFDCQSFRTLYELRYDITCIMHPFIQYCACIVVCLQSTFSFMADPQSPPSESAENPFNALIM